MNAFTASGNVGKDAELRYTPAGKAIAQFSLAVKSGYGEHEKTSWVICKLFGKQAEAISQYITKGSRVTVTGEFSEEKWNGHDGAQRSDNMILVRDIDLPPKSQSKQPQAQQQQQGGHAPTQHKIAPAQRPAPQSQPQTQPQQSFTPNLDDGWDDDIPF